MHLENVSPDDLELDLKNPRFGIADADTEPDALLRLVETADLKELWNSIAERGFEPFEPLVAIREGGKQVVLEGNRRLAAVKTLLRPELLGELGSRRRPPALSEEKRDTCLSIPVTFVETRDEADGFIGFKHVNGPSRWPSLAKAKFGVGFYERMDGSMSPRERMTSLTKQLGDSRGLIIRLLVAFKIIQQAAESGILESIDVRQDELDFSHLYTLINNPQSRAFIGLPEAPLSEALICDDPVPASHLPQLRELMGWLYGENKVIKSQGRDRPRLQKVLASSEGLAELRLSGSLDDAESVAGIKSDDWLTALTTVSNQTRLVAGDAAVVVPELQVEQIKQAKSIHKRIDTYLRQIGITLPEV